MLGVFIMYIFESSDFKCYCMCGLLCWFAHNKRTMTTDDLSVCLCLHENESWILTARRGLEARNRYHSTSQSNHSILLIYLPLSHTRSCSLTLSLSHSLALSLSRSLALSLSPHSPSLILTPPNASLPLLPCYGTFFCPWLTKKDLG